MVVCMKSTPYQVFRSSVLPPIAVAVVIGLSACGGGSDPTTANAAPSPVLLAAAPYVDTVDAQPTFHRMPLAVGQPSDIDRDGRGQSAHHVPQAVTTPPVFSGLSTKGLTDEVVHQYLIDVESKSQSPGSGRGVMPAATSTISVVYTPAQIRAAYNLPLISSTTLANLGAGQTIYIVDAYSHPNVVKDLNTFSSQFGLPTCAQITVSAASTSLPAASTNTCQIAVIYATSNGTMTTTAPAYNSGWAQEIALDTQWAHAIAPLARIVLIEAQSSALSNLDGAIILANKFGAGSVSMSFAAAEGSWVNQSSYSTSLFSTSGMSYFAATGDSGTQVNWPAVIAGVVGVGGTSLNYTSTTRSETTWSGTGGGISAYVTMPSYQTALMTAGYTIAGERSSGTKYRAVGDVSMDADPYTGVYVAFTARTASTTSWYAFGGTSLPTPMWAAAVTTANASRAANIYRTLSAPHVRLYGTLTSLGNYASIFYDITSGSNGRCSSCYAGTNYDAPTGLGTPVGGSLIPYLSNTL